MEVLTARYAQNLAGVLSCYDRIVITGTLPGACYAEGMTSFLRSREIRIFDYPQFALPLRERIRENAQALAAEHGAAIQHIAKAYVRKEEVVAKVLAARGDAPGLVHVISAMQTCATYQPWHDKPSGRTFLRPDTTKCLHYYFHEDSSVKPFLNTRPRRRVRALGGPRTRADVEHEARATSLMHPDPRPGCDERSSQRSDELPSVQGVLVLHHKLNAREAHWHTPVTEAPLLNERSLCRDP